MDNMFQGNYKNNRKHKIIDLRNIELNVTRKVPANPGVLFVYIYVGKSLLIN